MTNTNFMKYFATRSGMSQKMAHDVLMSLEDATKAYVKEMASGDSVKINDVVYSRVTIPASSGISPLDGKPWESPEHDVVKAKAAAALKKCI